MYSTNPPETRFFHDVVECDAPKETFILSLLKIYLRTMGLSKCQLGEPIKKCLCVSIKLKFIM
jgi:hypothetical protein